MRFPSLVLPALLFSSFFILSSSWSPAAAQVPSGAERIRLPHDPSLSPDGKTLYFSWRGDVWKASLEGGVAVRLTTNPARDFRPLVSPGGRRIAFASDREGGVQVWVMSAAGGSPRRITFNSEGSLPVAWFPRGEALLTVGVRDRTGEGRYAKRFYRVPAGERGPERLVFDTYVGTWADFSRDGRKLIFTREGTAWWRKGYRGSQASQVWIYDFLDGSFREAAADPGGCRFPRFLPGGKSFLYVNQKDGTFNLWKREIGSGREVQLTRLVDDGVQAPAVSRDGRTVVFRRLFDFYVLDVPSGEVRPLELYAAGDPSIDPLSRKMVSRASSASFTSDGKQIAFVAGGDVWVMDTVLRQPVRVTRTAAPEGEVAFLPDGKSLLFTSMEGGDWNIWEARPADPSKWWWLNREFKLRKITSDAAREHDLSVGPGGKRVAFLKGRGDLWVMDRDGRNARRVLASWSRPDYRWAPDGKWMVYSVPDADGGYWRNVWVLPLQGGGGPVNLSRHPNLDYSPAWSPDGRKIAWVTHRWEDEAELCWVYLRKEDEEKSSWDRKLEAALKLMGGKGPGAAGKKSRPGGAASRPARAGGPASRGGRKGRGKGGGKGVRKGRAPASRRGGEKGPVRPPAGVKVKIDFEGITERIHRIRIPGGTESSPFWGPGSKTLYFRARLDAGSGLYSVETGRRGGAPRKVGSTVGSDPVWLSKARCFGWLAAGSPGKFTPPSRFVKYGFSVPVVTDLRKKRLYAFDEAWRIMRDQWYDPRMNNRDWDEIRRKYESAAASCLGDREFQDLVDLMLGELNGSHLGFYMMRGGLGRVFRRRRRGPSPSPFASGEFREITWHPGVFWDAAYAGPGLRVKRVIPGGPADRKESRLKPGDLVFRVDGVPVDRSVDLTRVFNRPGRRPFLLDVRAPSGKTRKVSLLPTTYSSVRRLLFKELLRERLERVEKLSGGKLGYLLVELMDMPSFEKFQAALYEAGRGKDGLIIDVRNNGGGNTADRLLTALCQPVHAITVPRGGKPGYPRDRIVYARWNKPVVVLCNQNSFSNAEIFSHAIKTLKRGALVGVPTAGCVISTGAAPVLDVGIIRTPGRGWFLRNDGEDMELNGAKPDVTIWLKPGEETRVETDRQLTRAVRVLTEEVREWKAHPFPAPRYASTRR